MKQSTKLDLILKELYKHKHDGLYYSITEICREQKIDNVGEEEVFNLARRLKDDMLVNLQFNHEDAFATLTTYGIDYCEEDSYSYRGHSIITNNYINVTNSPNANVVSNSSNVTISITNYGDIKTKIDEIKTAVDKITDERKRQEILDCIEEVETSIEAGKKPKFAFASLTHIAGSLAEVGLLIIELGNLIFGH